MADPFRKDMTGAAWVEVYERQRKRAHLMAEWMDAIGLAPGHSVLEVGPGPGFVTLALADRVGPHGCVYAVDPSAEALRHLESLQEGRGLPQIRRIVADAAELEPADLSARSALVTMVLHHAEDPAAILARLASLLPPGGLAVIGEFHPAGPGEQGPPPEHRIDPEQISAWCEAAGLAVLEYRRQTPEHYMVLARR